MRFRSVSSSGRFHLKCRNGTGIRLDLMKEELEQPFPFPEKMEKH